MNHYFYAPVTELQEAIGTFVYSPGKKKEIILPHSVCRIQRHPSEMQTIQHAASSSMEIMERQACRHVKHEII